MLLKFSYCAQWRTYFSFLVNCIQLNYQWFQLCYAIGCIIMEVFQVKTYGIPVKLMGSSIELRALSEFTEASLNVVCKIFERNDLKYLIILKQNPTKLSS